MRVADISLGRKKAVGFEIALPHANLVLAVGRKGYVMCGYLNLQAAAKFGDAACIVRGVKTVRDLLSRPVAEVSPAARKAGIRPGISGKEALLRLL